MHNSIWSKNVGNEKGIPEQHSLSKKIALLFFSFLLLSSCARAIHPTELSQRLIVADYAKEYAQPLPQGLELPKEAIIGKSLFMVGEMHYVAANDSLKLDLVRQLSSQAGLRYLVLEINILHAALLDYCINEGDGILLDRLLSYMTENFNCADTRRFWHELLSWNTALPREKRVRVISFELAGYQPFYTLLPDLMPVPFKPDEFAWLQSDFDKATSPDADAYETYKSWLVFSQACISDDGSLAALFGAAGSYIVDACAHDARLRLQSFEDFANPDYSEIPTDIRRERRRDLALFRGMQDLLKQSDGSVLVWYGAAHITSNYGYMNDGISRQPSYGMSWFGELVRADPDFAKRSLSVGLIYVDCLCYYEQVRGEATSPKFYSDQTVFGKRLAETLQGRLYLLPTAHPSSPFDDHGIGVKTWSQYADYLVIVRGSGLADVLFIP